MIQQAERRSLDEDADERALYERLCGKTNLDDLIPTLAKDAAAIRLIESAAQRRPTRHEMILGDARRMASLPDESVQLVLTSPPYWTLKRYNDSPGQLGHVTSSRHHYFSLGVSEQTV